MPLRTKLLLWMITPAVLLAVVGIVGVFSVLHLEKAAGRILADNYQSIQQARRMERSLWGLEASSRASPDSPGRGAGPEHLAADFEDALRACEGNVTEPGEPEVLADIREAWGSLAPAFSAAIPLTADGRGIAASLHEAIAALVILNEGAMAAHERAAGRVARLMVGAVAVASLAATLALWLFALASAHRISAPIRQVADRLHRALNPESSHLIRPASGDDEIERLRTEVDDLLERLIRYEDEQNRKFTNLQGRLAFVINEVLEGVVLLDDQRRILAVNRVARRILAVGEGEGLHLADLEPREDVSRILAPLRDGTFQPERDLGELRFAVNGDERVYRPRVLTISGRGGAVEGYLLLFWDVTEQRRFEDARRRFIAMLSHQLKTPMTSLSMSVHLLREKFRDVTPQQDELLSIAAEDCNSLSRLVSELIEAAREPTPAPGVKPCARDLLPLLRSALRPLLPQARERGIELALPPEDQPVTAWVDPVKFPWVVTNIVGNALRYTGRGGRITVCVSAAGDRVAVTIADTGKGIRPEDLGGIFEPYATLDEQPESGTHGLGLAIAREIVEAHGGTIAVESEPGAGTAFRIELPLSEERRG